MESTTITIPNGQTDPFPSIDLIPKRDTQVLDFLKEHPQYDGKNVVIGILDTGVDPGATGLAFMEDGITPKLVDMIDCTGSGDVDIQLTRQVVDKGDFYQVESYTGKQLKLPKSWWKSLPQQDSNSEPSKTVQRPPATSPPSVLLGNLQAYDLFPNAVVQRVQEHRQMILDRNIQKYLGQARSDLADWQMKNVKTPEELRMRDELQARIDFLTERLWDKENDPGVLLDCLVFFDGQDHRAVIGVLDEDSAEVELWDWTDKTPLAAFHKERQYGTISCVDQYNYGVNIYPEAQLLSLVGDCTPHGTHVAAIACAADGERSGVAPGAQLVSIKIADIRLNAMERGTSLARGFMAAVRMGCHVVNLSFGEPSQVPNVGRIVRMAEELAWQHNIVLVGSVGNSGPALTTVNAPGGISSCMIGVAAYVSPEMMKAIHSLDSNTDELDTLSGSTYTWSSVGPAQDGHIGVSVCAPGGAITSVSNWTLQKSMIMVGTSMSSPQVCGCVALLLSACKAEGVPVSPARIKRALENTAQELPTLTSVQQGNGMVQVAKAFDHLVATKDFSSEDIHFQVSFEGRPAPSRGIYLRQPQESTRRLTFTINVKPIFRNNDQLDESAQSERINFEMKFAVTSTAPTWLFTPDHFMLMNNGRNFRVAVDGTSLSPGLHTAKVVAYDADHRERGAIFSLPVTIVKPLPEERQIDLPQLSFEAAEIKRFFVVPPLGSTWMDIFLRDRRDICGEHSTRMFVLHTVQLLPHASFRQNSYHKYLSLLPRQTIISSIPIEAGITCEVDIGRYWSVHGTTEADVTIEFRGVQPMPPSIAMNSGDAFALVRLSSLLCDESINPSAKFTMWKTPLRPKKEGVITVRDDYDLPPTIGNGKKMYMLVLTHEFTQEERGSFFLRLPALQGALYESAFEAQLTKVFDSDLRCIGYSDSYPRWINAPKGPIMLKTFVGHDDPSLLDKLKDMTIWIERKLDKEISLAAYETREDLVAAKKSMKKYILRKGFPVAVFFAEPNVSKIPAACKPGDVLIGSCNYASGDSSLPGEGKRPNGFPITYVVGPKIEKPTSETAADAVESKDERGPAERLEEAIRDLKLSQLDKLTQEEKAAGKFEEIYQQLLQEFPSHVPLLMANLKYLDNLKSRLDVLPQIIDAADKVILEISGDELALHFGRKQDKDDPEKVKKNKEMEKKKTYLIEALVRKALAHADSVDADASNKFNQVLDDLKAWVDIDSNGKYAAVAIERDCRAGRPGLAIKRINKLISKIGKDTGGVRPLTREMLTERRLAIMHDLGYFALCKRVSLWKLAANKAK